MSNKLLTLDDLKNMKRGIFAKGEFIDSPEDVNMCGTGKTVRWVASRGGIHDWAIYSQNPHYIDSTDPITIEAGYAGVWDWSQVASNGDKIFRTESIKKLVPCTDEALAMYRT